MNILISHNWLKEYLETNASPKKMAECLSLSSASVENLKKAGNDWVYDIEITTNRVDMMSVSGIARELAATLPQFGIKAKLKKDPYKKSKAIIPIPNKSLPLKVNIKKNELCPRFTAVVLDQVKVQASPRKITQRLERSGIRSINNIVDISNYLMRELGQPIHMFDYDKIKKQTMVMRESRKGETITTLDEKKQLLAGKDIVIEDGEKRLIDLCGIMGAAKSAVDKKTKKVLLFVQTYDPSRIRQTSMRLAHRTEAAQLFEKATDPELVMPAILKGIKMMEKMAQAKVASKIYDIYPQPYFEKRISVSLQFIEQRLGVKLQLNKVKKILEDLGFGVTIKKKQELNLRVPSWRTKDIQIGEDIVEEVARIYGYHNLPSQMPAGELPKIPIFPSFGWERSIKHLLKGWGFTETYTYSLQSKRLLKKFRLKPEYHLKLTNPLTTDWAYLRTSLLPSLLEVVKQNQSHENIRLFEMAHVYLQRQKDLPYEVLRLNLASNDSFYQVKGMVEQLSEEMGVEVIFEPHQKITQLDPKQTAIIKDKKKGLILGFIGLIYPPILRSFEIETPIMIADFNFDKLVHLAKKTKSYLPVPKYPPIIEHLTFINQGQVLAGKIMETAKKTHKLVKQVKILDVYQNRLSLEIIYQSKEKSLNDKEVGKIRKRIVNKLTKAGLKLHGQIS